MSEQEKEPLHPDPDRIVLEKQEGIWHMTLMGKGKILAQWSYAGGISDTLRGTEGFYVYHWNQAHPKEP